MKDAIEIKTEEIKRLASRKKFLTTKYQNTLTEELPSSVTSELKLIDDLMTEANVSDDVYQSSSKMITIRNSRDEEWYFQQLLNWIKRHPQATNGLLGKSQLYKFTLHFFVENIVLNPDNAQLSFGQLEEKISNLKQSKSDSTIVKQNRNIEQSLAFLISMSYRALNFIPESVNDDGLVEYGINPFSESIVKANGVETTLGTQSEVGKAYEEFQNAWSRDKQRLKKIKQPKGVITDD
ncbi:hypothetical protein [Leuconostoc mesenteroides]|uniref:hypothetical protein n=1 Tax=Leuconostoc mesenteroides TaxID=1245 RepID=UPI000B9D59F2|nr:hypothetical protein [Leuconostoc mesenteroides]BAX72898.1 hypothetical protein LEMES_01455 [Leuconostoc mesenteroides]